MTAEVALEGRGIIKRMNWNLLRDLVPDAGMNCMACNSPIEKKDIQAHHINLDSSDDRLCNLSFICRVCHHSAHTNSDKGWRRSLYPIASMKSHKKNILKLTWEERFDKRFEALGGTEGFKIIYASDISLADIGIKYGCVRERIRQYAVRLGLPPRGRGFMKEKEHKTHGFPYRHKPLSDYLYKNGIKPTEFADKIGKSGGWVYQLLGMSRPVSASKAIEIISATNGSLTVDELMNPAAHSEEHNGKATA